MKLTPEQVEALDVGTVVGRLADLKTCCLSWTAG